MSDQLKILDDWPCREFFNEGVVKGLEIATGILMEAREGDRDGDFRSLISTLNYIARDYDE